MLSTSAALIPVDLVHPHVQRRVLGVGEAAVGLVELHGGDAEVEQDALDAGDAQAFQDLGQFVVDGVHQGGPVTEGREPLAGEAQGLLVAVEGDQARRRGRGEQGLAVAAETEGAVDDDRPRLGRGPGPTCPGIAGASPGRVAGSKRALSRIRRTAGAYVPGSRSPTRGRGRTGWRREGASADRRAGGGRAVRAPGTRVKGCGPGGCCGCPGVFWGCARAGRSCAHASHFASL